MEKAKNLPAGVTDVNEETEVSLDLADLSTKDHAEGHYLSILNWKNNQPTGIEFEMLGMDSKVIQKVLTRQRDERLRKQAKYGRKYRLTDDDLKEEANEVFLVAIRSWRQATKMKNGKPAAYKKTILLSGQELECTDANKLAILTDTYYKFIREQVDEDLGDRAAFLN